MKRYSVQIKDGEAVVKEPLPTGASLRLEFCFDENGLPHVTDVETQRVCDEPKFETGRPARRMARGTPHPDAADAGTTEEGESGDVESGGAAMVDETRVRDAGAAVDASAGAAEPGSDSDEVDFETQPTFEIERSQLDAVAQGRLPLPPPPVGGARSERSERTRGAQGPQGPPTGNVLAPLAGSTQDTVQPDVQPPEYASLDIEEARGATDRRYDALLIGLWSAILVVVAAVIAVLLSS